jgi:hypothetical protein
MMIVSFFCPGCPDEQSNSNKARAIMVTVVFMRLQFNYFYPDISGSSGHFAVFKSQALSLPARVR